jgi:tripartite-type tricarboxylate transporter receptor subunit TctC
MDKRFTLKALAAAALLALGATAQAAYPDKPIKLVVPFSAGGTTDVVARQVAPKVAEILGQPVIIENKGGAGASIGTELVAKSPADGYTLLMATNSHTVNPYVYKNLSFDTAKDFVSIALIADTPGIFVVHPSVKANNVKEFVELAKKANPPLTYGTAGAGTWPHLTTLLFTERAKIDMTHVPYKGAGPAMIDLLGGVYQFKAEGIATGLQQVKAGKLKALGMTSLERVPQLPDVPTVAEQGYPGYQSVFWMAILAPAGTPKDVVAKLESAFLKALEDKSLGEKFESLGVRVIAKPANELDKMIQDELRMWPAIVKRAGINAN